MRISGMVVALLVSFVVTIALSGCASGGLRNSIPANAVREASKSGKPVVIVSKQGAIPMSEIYRTYWPDAPAAAKDGVRGIPLELIPIIGDAITAAGQAGTDYYKTQREMYRYRTDIGVLNVDDLTVEMLREILSHGTRPVVDADRPAYRITNEPSLGQE